MTSIEFNTAMPVSATLMAFDAHVEEMKNNNNNEVLIKFKPLVLPELGALYRKKKARTVQQKEQANSSMDSTPADTTYITHTHTHPHPAQ